MLNALILFSLKNRYLVVALAALILAYGGYILTKLPVDVFPDLNRPTVTIFTEAEGLAPEEVESLVTWPIETGMNGATGVERVRSASTIGLSIVWVEFGWAVDVYRARQIVTEKLQQIKERLPAKANPVLGPIASIMGEIMLVGLTSDNPDITPLDLRTLAEWDVRNRLLALPGVAQVTAIGGDMKQFQVLLDPFKLSAYGKSLHDVEAALSGSNVNSTGGFMLKDYQEFLIRNVARLKTPEDLAAIPLPDAEPESEKLNTTPVTLSQLAEIRVGGPLAKRGDGSINGHPAVILSIQKQPGADTTALTALIEQNLRELAAALPKGVTLHSDIFRQSTFISRAISNVTHALRDGSLLVIVVLLIFLLNFRTTFITLTAIPLSFVVTALIFRWFDVSINTMTLGGLAIAIGELVDDAIIGVENVFRRLRENRQLPKPCDAMTVVYEASSEVRNSIVFATVIVLLVFVPLFAMQGIEGRIFAPLGVAYLASIAASMLVSLTVTPALSLLLLPRMRRMHEHEGLLIRTIKGAQRILLNLLMPVRYAVFLVLGAAFLGTVLLFATFGKEFLPEFNEGSVTINLLLPPGTSLAESNRIGTIAEKLVLEVPEATKTGRRTGRAERDDHAEGVHSSEIEVELKESARSRKDILADIRDRLDMIPGIAVNIGQPISHRIDHMLSGVRAQIAIKLFGDDLDVLRARAEEIREVMAGVPGIVDLSVEKQVLIPQVHVRIDRARASQNGVLAGEVADYAELALQGRAVTQVLDGQRTYDVVMRLKDEARNDLESIRAIPVDVPGGHVVPLGLLAEIDEAKGPNIINRENAQRRIVIQANVEGRDLVGVVRRVQASIDQQIHLPQGYHLTYGGQFESQASASRLIALLSLISLGGMFLVLFTHFRDVNLALQVMVSIPLAFIGAAIGVWLTGGVFSIATMVGFVTLTGIAARNGIMMITHYLHLMAKEGERFDLEMLYRGSAERIIPVLMTALTAALALVPLMVAADEPGREILHPVAVVIFSGLFSSTLLDLAVRPLMFWSFARRPVAKLLPQAFQPKEI